MKSKTFRYLLPALALAAAACEHQDIYEELDFSVRLASGNTYLAGDPVVFEFRGNADYITVWNGDTGHEYRHRERTKAPDAFLGAELQMEISQQYGNPALEIYYTSGFEGLKGREWGDLNAHAEEDEGRIRAVEQTAFEGWQRFDFPAKTDGKFHTFTADISDLGEDFCLLMRIRTPEGNKQIRTYGINPRIETRFERYGTRRWEYGALEFVPFRTAGLWIDQTPYVCSIKEDFDAFLAVNQNGIVKFGDGVNPLAGAAIGFQGFKPDTEVNAGKLPGVTYLPVDQWIVMKPFDLATLEPDTGQNIKGVTDDVFRYEHTYDLPGTYTATFVVSTGNYQNASERELREVTFTVVDRLE